MKENDIEEKSYLVAPEKLVRLVNQVADLMGVRRPDQVFIDDEIAWKAFFNAASMASATSDESAIAFHFTLLNRLWPGGAEEPKPALKGIIAHELSHIALGHTTDRRYEADQPQYERDADRFAAEHGFRREVIAGHKWTLSMFPGNEEMVGRLKALEAAPVAELATAA